MQNVALEMNLSETAFLIAENDGYRLRWFTPSAEVDFAATPPWPAPHIFMATKALPENISRPSSTRKADF